MTAPPFQHTSLSNRLCADVLRLVGRHEGLSQATPEPQLRRRNRIQTVASTAAIEGNTLSLDQVSALFDGRHVVGPAKDILEVRNTITAYEEARRFRPDSVDSLRDAHRMLMRGLLPDAGKFRSAGVGIFRDGALIHTAPPADRVTWLVDELFHWISSAEEEHPLIRSCVAHYELAFIHPFADGNGRTARLWHHIMLRSYAPVFEFVPMESIIHERQQDYYQGLFDSDRAGSSTPFLEFSLQAIHDALSSLLKEIRPVRSSAAARLGLARDHFEERDFARKDYMAKFETLSSAQASRDLRRGVDDGMLQHEGRGAQTRYRFRRNPKT